MSRPPSDSALYGRICRKRTLRAAWEHVYANDLADGMAAPSLQVFAKNVDGRIDRLADQLSTGNYQPRNLTPVDIPKDDGEVRTLLVPSADDRVVERAAAMVLRDRLDRTLAPSSFAYRPGLGVGDAVRRVVDLREQGYRWAVRTDIDDCFPSIPPRRLLKILAFHINEQPVLDLIEAFLDPARRPLRMRSGVGIPQGGALSPMLSNVYLDRFDVRMLSAGMQVVRYADDIVIPTRTKKEAKMALDEARRAASALDLELGAEDTEIMSFDEGFAFLGEDFNTKYPPAADTRRVDPPRARTLYVGRPGAYVRIGKGRILVLRDKVELLSVPASRVGAVVVAGSVTLSAGLRAWALERGIDVVFLSRRGSFQGFLASSHPKAVERRRAQFTATGDPAARLAMGRSFAAGKLHNQRVLLMRFNSPAIAEDVGEAIDEIGRLSQMLPDATDIDQINGLEGAAARAYFRVFGLLLPDDVTFGGRSRRPPLDVVNAALSYGYAVLEGQASGAVAAAGLDPTVGFLHGDDRQRLSLSLDLMEEFRPLIVDEAVVEAFRRSSLTESHGRTEKSKAGVLLTERGRRALLSALEQRFIEVAYHPTANRRSSYRRHLHVQAQQVAACIDTGSWDYKPVEWRS